MRWTTWIVGNPRMLEFSLLVVLTLIAKIAHEELEIHMASDSKRDT
jgi:hypothetical protein